MPRRRGGETLPDIASGSAAGAAVAMGAVALVVYLLTLHHGVPGGDSGELIAAAATGGVAHPPGYPLFLLLARLAATVPIGHVATRVNALSAIADAAAAGVLTFAASLLFGNIAGGILAGGLFAFSVRVWAYATVAEVFALNNLIVAGLIATVAAARRMTTNRHVALASFLAGLGLANHMTSVFVSAPVVVWLFWSAGRHGARPWPLLGAAAIGGFCGLLPYGYLPIASASAAPVSWGDETTLAGLVRQFLRSDYGTFQLAGKAAATPPSPLDHVATYLSDVPGQLLWIGVPLALASVLIVRGRRDLRGPLLALGAGLACYVLVFNALSNLPVDRPLFLEVQSRFWQMPNLILCVFVAGGFAMISASMRTVPRSGWLVLAIGAVVAQAALNCRAMDESGNQWAELYGQSILAAAPPGALVLSSGDLITNTARYLRYVEQVRPDVQIVDQEILSRDWGMRRYVRQMPDVRFPGAIYDSNRPDGYSIKELIDANIGRRRILVCGGFRSSDTSVTPAAYRLAARGLCVEVERAGTPLQVDAWLEETRGLLPDVGSIARASLRPGTWEEVVRSDFWTAWYARAHFLMMCGDCGSADDDRLWRSLSLSEEILQQGPNPPPKSYKDRVYALTKLYPAHPDLRDSLVLAMQQYLEVAPPDDPQLPVIRKNLAKLRARAS